MRPSGLSSSSRADLSKVLRGNPPIVSASMVADKLAVPMAVAARRLSAWSRAGWLARVRRGAYVPVPIEAESADIALDDAWAVAATMFAPCYVSGWSAAEHWGLTEQIFRSVCVMTAGRPRNRHPKLRKVTFDLHTVPQARFFGLKTVWRDGTRVQVADPARALVDMLDNPALGGGIRNVAEMLGTFLREHPKDAGGLAEYARKIGSGAIGKRLGFLLQRDHQDQTALIETCRSMLTTGYARLDPRLPAERLVTSWRVWVSAGELRKERV